MNATATIIPRELLAPFCLRHGIRRVALFGSMLTGRARPDSDIDLLVEFETGRSPGLIGIAALEAELSGLIGGRRVDLRTPQDLSDHFRDEVMRSALEQYAH